jgi:hypothetical protein
VAIPNFKGQPKIMKHLNQRAYSISFLLLVTFFCNASFAQTSAAKEKKPVHGIYISTGDNLWTGNSLPIDSRAAIEASFDLIKAIGFDRIYWRGLEMAVLMKYAHWRKESVRYYNCIEWFRGLYANADYDRFAVASRYGAWATGPNITAMPIRRHFGTIPSWLKVICVYSIPSGCRSIAVANCGSRVPSISVILKHVRPGSANTWNL